MRLSSKPCDRWLWQTAGVNCAICQLGQPATRVCCVRCAGQKLATHHDVALVIKLDLTLYNAAVGLVPNAIEEPFDGQLPPLACSTASHLERNLCKTVSK